MTFLFIGGFCYDTWMQSWTLSPLLQTWWRKLALGLEKLLAVLPLFGYKIAREMGLAPRDVQKEILTFWVLQFNIRIKVSPDCLASDLYRAMDMFLDDRTRLFQLIKLIYYTECIMDSDWVSFGYFCFNCPRIYIWHLFKILCVRSLPLRVRNALTDARKREEVDEFYSVDMSFIPEY